MVQAYASFDWQRIYDWYHFNDGLQADNRHTGVNNIKLLKVSVTGGSEGPYHRYIECFIYVPLLCAQELYVLILVDPYSMGGVHSVRLLNKTPTVMKLWWNQISPLLGLAGDVHSEETNRSLSPSGLTVSQTLLYVLE